VEVTPCFEIVYAVIMITEQAISHCVVSFILHTFHLIGRTEGKDKRVMRSVASVKQLQY
jgi:hypothetical protein